jgi:uncharacterized protein
MQKRHIWSKLRKEINTDEVVVITGPRQVGKTTTLKWLLKQIPSENKFYFDLENLANRELFEVKNYDSLVNELQNRGLSLNKKLYLALDEIQLLQNLPSLVKYLYDHYQIKFFLSGSSSYYIKNKFTESMAGRKVIYEMFPLSFQEFLSFQNFDYNLSEELPLELDFADGAYQQLNTYYQEYIEYGGLPKVVLTADVKRKKKLLEEIFSSYINIDVQTLADFKSITDLSRVIKLIAARIGSRLNVSEIANITGLSRITIDNYLTFLEQTYLIINLPAYSNSADVQLRLQKKPYFIDTGIANLNADLSAGSKFENTVRHQLSFYSDRLSYFADRSGEIDFILEDQSGPKALEVKETPTAADQRILKERARKLGISNCRIIGKEPSATFSKFLWAGLLK